MSTGHNFYNAMDRPTQRFTHLTHDPFARLVVPPGYHPSISSALHSPLPPRGSPTRS
ncbi:hypothetical protein M404DRAFT_1007627 [Pisolithus tinctorius Marx 270]|uniref:Uncharacterized protein n=1 Tax=Pisolithus tinctorius Marx 270 TaxID=870435 RepID=A0A0C3IE79_PISTI|nr:hypothetical protein M404DRAFT_1007627 [Pisolithus tinctorius Marx 270]